MAIAGIGNSVYAGDLPTAARAQAGKSTAADSKASKGTPPAARSDTTRSAQATRAHESQTATLEGQIRIARQQLNDWVTCVSATTPKGQAAIGPLTAQISAAQEQIDHLSQSASSLDVWA